MYWTVATNFLDFLRRVGRPLRRRRVELTGHSHTHTKVSLLQRQARDFLFFFLLNIFSILPANVVSSVGGGGGISPGGWRADDHAHGRPAQEGSDGCGFFSFSMNLIMVETILTIKPHHGSGRIGNQSRSIATSVGVRESTRDDDDDAMNHERDFFFMN